MKKNSFSIQYRILIWCFVLLLPLVLSLSVFTVLQVDQTRRLLVASEQTNLHLLAALMQQETDNVEKYLYDLTMQNRVFRSMADVQPDVQLYSSAYEVLEASDNLFRAQQDLTFLVLYSEANEYYADRDCGLDYLTLQEQSALRQAVEKRCVRFFLEGNGQQRGWFTVEISGRWFLTRMIRYRGMYCACLFDLEAAISHLQSSVKADSGLVFRTGRQLLTPMPEQLSLEGVDFTGAGGSWAMNRYGVLDEALCGIQLTYLFPYDGILGVMGWSYFLIILIAVLVLTMLPLIYLRLNRGLFRPLDNLVATMQCIRDGQGGRAVQEKSMQCKEFRQVNEVFEQMLAQIQNLKIEQYEQEIETQKAELSFLLAQIRPHFYLNCLKTLYSLAEQREYADIETCILLVSKHLRYAFQAHADTVPMREELSLCDNYVKLYAMMTEELPTLTVDIESQLFDFLIPPISLLTFVENSIRINLTPHCELKIKIRAKRMQTEEGSVLCLTVQDNGAGFSAEQLAQMNTYEWANSGSSHVGLQNVIRRFRILYGDDFSIAFFNHGGAVIELYLPMKSGEREAAQDETADCR